MTVILTVQNEDGETCCTSTVRRWTVADREQHEAMGYEPGWGMAADQLEAAAKAL